MFITCKFNEHTKVDGASIILWIDLIVGDRLSRATFESVGWLSPFPLHPSRAKYTLPYTGEAETRLGYL